jgi:hypothetical protein
VRPSPLPNRVDPFGALIATPARGDLFGNRGGKFHCERTHTVPGRPYATKQWICCVLSFKDRQRNVWGRGYTELFFRDEATALAAGHRPCFECRRADAVAFAAAWRLANGGASPRAPEMDMALHAERLDAQRGKRMHRMPAEDLPDGTMITRDGAAWLVRSGIIAPWSFTGYGPTEAHPCGMVDVLTPPSIVATLRAGYRPLELRASSETPMLSA